MNQQAPNLFIVGAPKCGTTSLYHFLNSHPEVYMSPEKEPHFLAFNDRHEYESVFGCKNFYTTLRRDPRPVIMESVYLDLFKTNGNFKRIGEASTSYLYSKLAPLRISEKYNSPDLRILIFLRNPVERAYSQFLHHVRDGLEYTEDFFEAFNHEKERLDRGPFWHYMKVGLYAEQVKRFVDLFGREKIKVIKFEDFKKDTNCIKGEICDFLGIETIDAPQPDIQYNKTGIPENKRMHNFFLFFSKMPYASNIKKKMPEKLLHMFRRQKNKNLSKPKLDIVKKRKAMNHYRDNIRRLEEITGKSFADDWKI